MRVRPADIETDALAIVDGARDFIARMDFTDVLPEGDDLVAALGRVLAVDGLRVLVAEHDGIVGGIGLFYAPHLWNPDILAAEELFWWTDREAPRTTALALLRAARDDMRAHGVRFATFKALTSSPGGVDAAYRRLGLRPVETVYAGMI